MSNYRGPRFTFLIFLHTQVNGDQNEAHVQNRLVLNTNCDIFDGDIDWHSVNQTNTDKVKHIHVPLYTLVNYMMWGLPVKFFCFKNIEITEKF